MDCLPCGQGFITASPGAVGESQCEDIQKSVTTDKITISTPLATSRYDEAKKSTNKQLTTKTPEEAKEQENAEEFFWKLPVTIGTPLAAVLVLGAILLVFFIRKRRRVRRNYLPARTAQFENPAYLGNPNVKRKGKRTEDNEYSFAEGPEDGPGDGPEDYDDNGDFKTKDADEPI